MKKWTMFVSAIAFLFLSCSQQHAGPGIANGNLSVTQFDTLKAAENFTVTISRGSNPGVYATGSTDELANQSLETGCQAQCVHE